MAFKRDSWFVKGVLVLAVAAFVAVPLAFMFNGRAKEQTAANSQAPTAADQTAQFQNQADGFTAVLAREPDNQTALIGLIEAKIGLKDLEGAVEPLTRLSELNPNEPQYAIALAQTKQQLGDLEGAAQIYRSVLTQKPGDMQALEGLVALLISQERSEAAAGLLQDTLATADQTNQLAPNSVDKLSVNLLLGQVYVSQQDYDQAIAIYDETIKAAEAANPTQPDFRPVLAKALVLLEKGDSAAADPLFEKALATAPTQYKDNVQKLINQKKAEANGETGAAADPAAEGDAATPEPSTPVAPPAE
ncbi:MAG: Tfp pilus assembly protein PilF [Leptolyngbya foveolarum]|uniref:Tfp pilus assembly protein PilF n=1 Tax=Leptolyngbya foveolarum TaxID=47253 RepID=A0A2W4UG63_9CYAN|nr:MAG: Tfp pilus assembly protein PilF [Leptolyngbya foveolarum]